MVINKLWKVTALCQILICGKVFERSICYSLFEFFSENESILSYQSVYEPGNSCINHLLSITHEIYKSFDDLKSDIDAIKSRVFCLVYQKHLIKFDIMDS